MQIHVSESRSASLNAPVAVTFVIAAATLTQRVILCVQVVDVRTYWKRVVRTLASGADRRAFASLLSSSSNAGPTSANSGTNSLNQARVAAGQGQAANLSSNDSGASDAAKHPFDAAGGVPAPMPVVAGIPASAQVPEKIKILPAYKAMIAEKEKLQNRMKQLDLRLTEIRTEQAKSPTPNQDLTMEAVKIKQEMSVIPSEIAITQTKIDKFVVSMEEEATPPKGKDDKTPPKTSVPPPPHQ